MTDFDKIKLDRFKREVANLTKSRILQTKNYMLGNQSVRVGSTFADSFREHSTEKAGGMIVDFRPLLKKRAEYLRKNELENENVDMDNGFEQNVPVEVDTLSLSAFETGLTHINDILMSDLNVNIKVSDLNKLVGFMFDNGIHLPFQDLQRYISIVQEQLIGLLNIFRNPVVLSEARITSRANSSKSRIDARKIRPIATVLLRLYQLLQKAGAIHNLPIDQRMEIFHAYYKLITQASLVKIIADGDLNKDLKQIMIVVEDLPSIQDDVIKIKTKTKAVKTKVAAKEVQTKLGQTIAAYNAFTTYYNSLSAHKKDTKIPKGRPPTYIKKYKLITEKDFKELKLMFMNAYKRKQPLPVFDDDDDESVDDEEDDDEEDDDDDEEDDDSASQEDDEEKEGGNHLRSALGDMYWNHKHRHHVSTK